MRGAAEEAAVIMTDDVCVYGFYTCSFCLWRRSLNWVQHSFHVKASKAEMAARRCSPSSGSSKNLTPLKQKQMYVRIVSQLSLRRWVLSGLEKSLDPKDDER